MLDNRVQSRNYMETTTFDNVARGKVEKNLCALHIARGAKTNGRHRTGLHGISWCVLFMSLAI